jgi:hypothetical protein
VTFVAAVLLIPASTVFGQTYTGYQSCAGQECHTKSGEVDWLTSKPGGQEHRGSLGKIRQARDNSEKYAKAVKLANFEDPKGMCVKCHGTFVAKAQTLEGVGCEACHGPAGGYREFHNQTPKDYAGAVSRGMRNLQRKPAAWVPLCRDCHVLDGRPEYTALIEEGGHKDGARWRVQAKYEGVAFHWKKAGPSYTPAIIAAVAAGKPVDIPAAPAPAPTAAPAPAPPPAAAPPVVPPAAQPQVPTPPAAGQPRAGAPVQTRPAPVANTPAPAAILVPPPPAAAPMGGEPPVVSSPLGLTPPPPVTASGLIAALQDRVAGLLESLLRSNTVPAVPLKAPDLSPRVSGSDAEFLRLQSEALALAVEVLNLRAKPPATPAPGAPK